MVNGFCVLKPSGHLAGCSSYLCYRSGPVSCHRTAWVRDTVAAGLHLYTSHTVHGKTCPCLFACSSCRASKASRYSGLWRPCF